MTCSIIFLFLPVFRPTKYIWLHFNQSQIPTNGSFLILNWSITKHTLNNILLLHYFFISFKSCSLIFSWDCIANTWGIVQQKYTEGSRSDGGGVGGGGLEPQVSPKKIMSREVELGCKSWTSFTSGCFSTAVQQTLSLWLPSTAVETATVRCTDCCAMAKGHCCNTSTVLVAVHGLSGLFWPSLSRPLPTLSPSLISNLASVDVKQNGPIVQQAASA